jgi:hypothetical protein
VALSELASDAQSESFEATRRKIAERSGVSIRRVSDILARLRSSNLLNWEQNYLEGTKELAASTYTLTPCTSSSTSCGPCTTLGTGVVSANCTVVEQSPEQLTEKSGKKPSREPWQIEKDRERIEREIQDLKRTGRKTFKDKFGVEHTERELTDEAKSRLDNLQMKIQALSQ